MAGLIYRIGGSISDFAAKLRGDDASDKAIIPRVWDPDSISAISTLQSLLLSSVPNSDFGLMVARGLVPGVSQINKYGSAPNGVQTTSTDIWSRADATPTQQIWLAPTAPRVHAIVSSSVQDIAGGTGAVSVIVRGLKTWDSIETSETVLLNGNNPVNTANAYVIIHRMKAVAQSTTTSVGVNVGTITATAAVDGTITAVILPNDGQTEMAIYGVPSTQKLYMKRWSAALDRATGAAAVSVSFQLRVNENPNIQTLAFIRKDDIATLSAANNRGEHNYDPPLIFPGPCIIKVQGIGSAADIDAESAFDAYLVNN